MSDDLFMGVDIGTTNLKIGVFDGEGNPVRTSRCGYRSTTLKPRINPLVWWETFLEMISEIPNDILRRIRAISVVGHGPTIVPIGRNGEVVGKAITWLDKSGEELVEKLLKDGLDMMTAISTAKLISLKKELENSNAEKVYILQPHDYLVFMMTGKITNSSFNERGYMPWYEEFLEKYELLDTFELPEFFETTQVIGKFVNSKRYGFSDEVMVIAGTIDFVSSIVGTGTVKSGLLCDAGGTSQGLTLCHEKRGECRGLIISPFFLDGLWKISGVINTSGGALEWISRMLKKDVDELVDGTDPYSPTSIVFLPHLNGERNPDWNPDAKGVFFGLSLDTDEILIVQAMMEGICFAMRDIIERMKECGFNVDHIRVAGKQAFSNKWNILKTNVVGVPIEIPKVKEADVLGCAVFAMVGLMGDELTNVVERVVRIEERVYPNPEVHDEYSKKFEIYLEMKKKLRDLFPRLKE